MKISRAIILILTLISPHLIVSPSYSFSLPFSIPPVLPGEVQEIDIVGSTVRIKGLTNQNNKLTINGRSVPIQKDGSFQKEIIIPLGETEIVVRVEDPQGNTKTYKKEIKAKENHFFLVGLADGTLNFSESDGGVS